MSKRSVFSSTKASHKRRRSCTLMITRRCNLNCTYCYEEHKCNDTAFDMTFETAKRLLRAEFSFVRSSPDFDEIEIDFMGGEPFMNFPLIKQVVEWLECEPPPVPYICFATTNGTFVAQHKEWLSRHRDQLVLGGSVDGTDEMQVANRGRRLQEIPIDLFLKLYPFQGFHMTVSKHSLPRLASGVLTLQRRGCLVEVALAQGESWSLADAEEYERQLDQLATAYLTTDRTLRPINLLSRFLGGIDGAPAEARQKKYCGTGTHMVAYDYDGRSYGCHLFTPVVLGDKARICKSIEYSCPDVVEDAYCQSCILKVICPTCAGFNFRYRGSIGVRDHRWCSLVLRQCVVSAIFQMKYVVSLALPTDEDIRYLRAAVRAHEVIGALNYDTAPFVLS